MEGRWSSDFYRNTSEELFIKTMMETSIGMPAPTMEMLGFKNLSQNFRTDSEELFKSWLNNGESNGFNSPSMGYRTRQASCRMSSELSILPSQQPGGLLQKKRSNDNLIPENNSVTDLSSGDLSQHSIRNAVEQELQASNLFLAKTWFHSSQPMTRSRSSELRRRYAAMQNSQAPIAMMPLGIEGMNNVPGPGINNLEQEFTNLNGLNDHSMCEIANQFSSFMSPSNSSSSTFNTPQVAVDGVSSVVSLLKGALERKKLGKQIMTEAGADNSVRYYGTKEALDNASLNQAQGNRTHEAQGTCQDVSTIQINDTGFMQTIGGSFDINMEGFVAPANFIPLSKGSREPSQSESSAAAPAVSAAFDVCDGQSISSQMLNICESSRKQVGNEKGTENGTRSKDIRERIYDNIKDDKKQKGRLVRYGSMTSASSVEKGDSTKKRRVERSKKMAEAKERNLTPAIPSDVQSILKRCENLEKEVRSLKLNLAFMNRKDSEQTKQIEELQKQNEELAEEKERLLEEIERIISETGKM